MIYSFAVLILAMLCLDLVYRRNKIVHVYFKARHNIRTGITCENFNKEILKPEYKITYDQLKNSGICDHAKKEIILTYQHDDDTLFALFQAGHEAGHAFFGPSFSRRNTHLMALLFTLSFVAPVLAATLGGWLTQAFLSFPGLFLAVWCYQMYLSEAKASLYAGEKLRLALKGEDVPIAENMVRMDIFCRKLEYGSWFFMFSASVLFLFHLVSFLVRRL